MMDKRQVNLNDPAFEPSVEDFERLRRAASASVRAESSMLAARRQLPFITFHLCESCDGFSSFFART